MIPKGISLLFSIFFLFYGSTIYSAEKQKTDSLILGKAFQFFYAGDLSNAAKFFKQYIKTHRPHSVPLRYLAIISLDDQDIPKAKEYLHQAILLSKDDDESLEILADIYIDERDLTKAKELYYRILKKKPFHEDALFSLARIYQAEKNVKKAIVYYRRLSVASENTGNQHYIYLAYNNLANHYYKQGLYEKAISYYEKMLPLNKNNLRTLFILGELYKIKGKFEKSNQLLRQALEIKPDYRSALESIITNYYILKNFQTRSMAKNFIEEYPVNFSIIEGIFFELDDKLEKAEKLFLQVLKEKPNSLAARIGLVRIYKKAKKFDAMMEEASKVIFLSHRLNALAVAQDHANLILNILSDRNTKIDFQKRFFLNKINESDHISEEIEKLAEQFLNVYANHAYTIEKKKYLKKSLVYYKEALRYTLQLKEWYEHQAASLNDDKKRSVIDNKIKDIIQREYQLKLSTSWILQSDHFKKYKEAIQGLKESIQILPQNSRASFLLGVVYYKLGEKKPENYDLSIKYIQKAIDILSEEEVPSNYYFHLGISFEKNNNFEEAEKNFKKAIELEPDNAFYLNYLGYMYSLRGDKLDEADQLLTKALEQDPGNEAYLDSLGWLLYKKKDYNTALQKLLMAVNNAKKNNNVDPVIYFHLAETYYSLNRFFMAYIYFQKTIERISEASETLDEDYILKKMKKIKGQ